MRKYLCGAAIVLMLASPAYATDWWINASTGWNTSKCQLAKIAGASETSSPAAMIEGSSIFKGTLIADKGNEVDVEQKSLLDGSEWLVRFYRTREACLPEEIEFKKNIQIEDQKGSGGEEGS